MIALAGARCPTVPEGEPLATMISNFKCHIAEERTLCVVSSYKKTKVQDLGKPSGLGFSPGKLSCPTREFALSAHLPQSVKLQQKLQTGMNGSGFYVICGKVVLEG